VLQVDWEVQANIDKAKACLEFVLTACKCRTGCLTCRCSCKKNDRMCGPSCNCINCTNSTHTPVHHPMIPLTLRFKTCWISQLRMSMLMTVGMIWRWENEELAEIVNLVYGPDSDEDLA